LLSATPARPGQTTRPPAPGFFLET